MKTDINKVLGKLISFARDNLMLDALDEDYTLNRLAAIVGVSDPSGALDADCGDESLSSILDELKTAAPNTDTKAVIDAIMPLPHTVNYYFTDTLGRSAKKAFDFLFELYASCGCAANAEAHTSADGFVRYTAKSPELRRPIVLDANGEIKYAPLVLGNHIAELDGSDIMSDDIAKRECAFVSMYGGAIATRIGGDGKYYSCTTIAPTSAKVKQQLASGAVKIALLDYPVPTLAVSGIAKNSVAASAARIIKAAAEENLPCVAACAADDGVTFYIIFANPVAAIEGITLAGDELAACGVFGTADLSELTQTLEKGTALSADLSAFKAIHNAIGGVKLGAKADSSLSDTLADMFKKSLASAASTDEAKATTLVK